MEGNLFSLAGIDGSGKSTQVHLVTQALRDEGLDVVSAKTELWATDTVFELARSLTGDPHDYHPHVPATLREFVVACDVATSYRRHIAPLLAAGRTVIWDRGPLCYRAYARAYEADPEWITPVHDMVPWPVRTFLLELDADTAWLRVLSRSEKPSQTDEAPEFLRSVRRAYLEIAQHAPVTVIDASASTTAVTDRIVAGILAVVTT
ncbi:dTMP kinase [Nocardioides fonticola]